MCACVRVRVCVFVRYPFVEKTGVGYVVCVCVGVERNPQGLLSLSGGVFSQVNILEFWPFLVQAAPSSEALS